MRARAFSFEVAAAGLLLVGLALRLAILASPLGEIDGDEAVVGLMARHIAFSSERPVFYWGQPYLGSLEAFSAAPLFALFDSSTPLLKLVPIVYSLGFLLLNVLLARRLFGTPPALATGVYLALPPSMWAVWSTKARGGYAEVLFLGQALLLTSLYLAERHSARLALLWGAIAGVAIWTHLLAAVYVVPTLVYMGLRRRAHWSISEIACALGGAFVGALPLIWENVLSGWRSLAALTQAPDLPVDIPAQFVRFFRIGVPVLVGLGQPTTSETMFDADWGFRPAGHLSVALIAVALLLLVMLCYVPSVKALVKGESGAAPALLVFVALAVPPAVAGTRFGFFVSEPRYALPLYSTVPLLFGAVWSLRPVLRWLAVVGLVVLNVWSLLTTDPRLWRPEDALDSTAATRSQLVDFLVAQDRHQMYTDYWIGYPIMFETRETVLAYVISGGFNRYLPPADNVQRTPNPAWVFVPDTLPETMFLDQLGTV
ncbi:MAG: glycosyltransferase family 39 protein, partial [Chloroflexi bacterium]|nr:glycosyltransferase family 39 protein [Chloroflexota bacterium]